MPYRLLFASCTTGATARLPWAHGQAIADAWPGSRLVEAAGLGHTRLLRDPEILGTAAEFIAALPARRVPLAAAS